MNDRTGPPDGGAPWDPYRQQPQHGGQPQHGQQPPYVQPGPDWQALAERNEAGLRRRRRLQVGGAVLGALCVVAAAGGAVLWAGGGGHASATASGSPQPTARTTPGPTPTPTPSPTPLTPLQVISSSVTDTAPLSTKTLYDATRLTIGGRVYTLAATATSVPCWKGTTGGLGNVLAAHDCRELLRSTYVSKDHAVTVGVAVFDTAAQADAVLPKYVGQIQSLFRTGVPVFCLKAACSLTHAAVGRYDYFTIAGPANGRAGTGDPLAVAAGQHAAAYAQRRLLDRG